MSSLKSLKIVLLISLVFVILLTAGFKAKAENVAVIGFESKGLPWTNDVSLEKEIIEWITNQYTDKLAEEDVANIVDRSRVQEVLTQLNYQTGEAIDLSAASQLGRLLESNLLIVGNIEKIELTKSAELSVGPLTFSGIEADVKLTARLLDIISGNVLANFTGSGNATETGVEISDVIGVSFSEEAFADTAAGNAVTSAVNELIRDTVNKKESFSEGAKLPKIEPIEAEVVAKVGQSLVIDKGINDGLKKEQKGKLIRKVEIENREELLEITLAQITVKTVDENTSLISVSEPEEEPKVGDIARFEPAEGGIKKTMPDSIETPGSFIKEIETPEFVIYIERVTKDGSLVTVHGTAEAKKEADLTLFFPGKEFNYYDHKGRRVVTDTEKVSIGSVTDSTYSSFQSSNVANLTETILKNYPQSISWSFGDVPEDADHLARVQLYLSTKSAGQIEITLEKLSLINKF